MANALIMAPLPMAAVTASSTSWGAAGNLANDYAGVAWMAATADDASITIDMGADVAVDTIAILGLIRPPSFATMTVYAATAAQGAGFGAGAFWAQAAAQPLYAGNVRLVNGYGVALWQDDAAHPAPVARYWRILFASLSGQSVQASRIAIGRRLRLDRNFKFGAAFGVHDFGKAERSDRGVLLRRRSKKLRTAAFTFGAVYRDEVEEQLGPLIEDRGVTDPVLLVTDPDPHAMRERRCYFGLLKDSNGTIWRTAAGHEWRAEVESIF